MLDSKSCAAWGLVLVRVGLAAVFIAHGYAKLANIDQTIAFFGSLGLASFFAYLVGLVELLGGLAMLLGVYTKYAGYLLALVMLVAIVKVKWAVGFMGGWEFDLVLLLNALAISWTGPGEYTVLRKTS